MMATKVKVVNAIVRFKLKQYLELMFQEAQEATDLDREIFLMSCYFVGCESLDNGTFEVVEDEEFPGKKRIIIDGIPDDVSALWTC